MENKEEKISKVLKDKYNESKEEMSSIPTSVENPKIIDKKINEIEGNNGSNINKDMDASNTNSNPKINLNENINEVDFNIQSKKNLSDDNEEEIKREEENKDEDFGDEDKEKFDMDFINNVLIKKYKEFEKNVDNMKDRKISIFILELLENPEKCKESIKYFDEVGNVIKERYKEIEDMVNNKQAKILQNYLKNKLLKRKNKTNKEQKEDVIIKEEIGSKDLNKINNILLNTINTIPTKENKSISKFEQLLKDKYNEIKDLERNNDLNKYGDEIKKKYSEIKLIVDNNMSKRIQNYLRNQKIK